MKAVVYTSLFMYMCNIIKEHNTLMMLPWSYTCDECVDRLKELKINEKSKSS